MTDPTPLDGDAIQARAEFVDSDDAWISDAPDGWYDAMRQLAGKDVPALLAALAKTVQQRDEARANAPEGGAWSVEYGHDLSDGVPTWWSTTPCPQGCNTQRRVWRGPAQQITSAGPAS